MWALMKVLILSFAAAVIGTGIGGAAGTLIKKNDLKAVSLMLSFAGGVMLAVVCFDLLPQAMDAVRLEGSRGLYKILLSIVCGYGGVGLLSSALCARPGGRHNMLLSGLILCAAIALHNFPEGMVIGSACALDGQTALGCGFVMAAVLGFHNIPEGMAVGVTLHSGGAGRLKTVLLCAAAGLPSVAGALLGIYMGRLSASMLAMSLSFSAGAMLYVVLSELLPEGGRAENGKAAALAAFMGMILGIVVL